MTVEFDPCGPLPTGVTVLEASAGTGKTYTIASLAARYIGEGLACIDQLLLVTFTRMATSELRERVRARLVSVERELADPESSEDAIVRYLAAGDAAAARARLSQAIESFDGATIATIHEFCGEVLGGLGIAGDVDRRYTFVEEPRDLIAQVVDDLYARYALNDTPPPLKPPEARRVAGAAIGNPIADLEPPDGEATVFAKAARKVFDRRKRGLSVLTFDDLLTSLRATLCGEDGDEVAERLRKRWPVVLVDEFQDTDPVQWEIVERAFGRGSATLVLIGDPKQAIYAFRGADVYAYLRAAAGADPPTLGVNWRSDQPLLDAFDALFDDAQLGHAGIRYRRVRAHHREPRLDGGAPLRVRVVRREPRFHLTQGGCIRVGEGRDFVADDLAQDIVRLLDSGAKIDGRPVEPHDIAVLVRRHHMATLVQQALAEARVPAVISGAGSVFGTPAAGEWLRLMRALERPTLQRRARSAALTCFIGWPAERVARASDAEWEDVYRRLHDWARVLRLRGVAALVEAITLGEGLPERVLSMHDGERRLTDLRHVGELLHAAGSAEQLGVSALTVWLGRRVNEAKQDQADERTRRLESDADAVQVLTIYRAKGLEFPIVYCPELWDPSRITKQGEPVDFHDPDDDFRRKVELSGDAGRWRLHRDETRGEDLRLAYVALTRAKHQAVTWWVPSRDAKDSALGRLVFAARDGGAVPPEGGGVPDDAAALARFREIAARAPGCLAVEEARLGPPPSWSPPLPALEDLGAAVWDREVDWLWRRTSYSDLSAGTHDARVGSEPEEPVVVDEPGEPSAVASDEPPDLTFAMPSLLAGMPVGLEIGTLVHRVFETTDFAAADLRAEVAARVDEALAWRTLDVGDRAQVVEGLAAAIETPLGIGCRLRDVGRGDRLDELAFELPLAGGDRPAGVVRLAAVAEVLRGDPTLAGYAERLAEPGLRHAVRGYLNGSIDLVLRHGGRFFVADYKTNWLAPGDEPLTLWHHRPAELAREMERRHYPLQALLYTVALHRYLRWRLAGYDPAQHLGGALYLFVRGMAGADTPAVDGTPCGVFRWQPAAATVQALSDVMDGAP
ncbi:MAG TPA: UvrD-helicase domain-containing protein [Solirubrobacteraceae bacterium]|nr:UvrD-helicase domain-containing protein [Solirubrobacteraceae bacterium]